MEPVRPVEGATVDLAPPQRALAIGAHPDDIEFGCGATLAKWTGAGCEAHMLVLTDGSKGTWDAHADLEALVALRIEEQRAAASVLGAASVQFLGAVDGELTEDRTIRARVCEIVRRTKPDVVFTHDPWRQYRLHPDHRHAGFVVIDALVAARDPHFFPEQAVAPHRPDALLLFEAGEVDHIERVDAVIGAKADALLAHRSQWRSTHGIDDDPDAQIAAFRQRIVDTARRSASTDTAALVEGFKRLTL
jgi:LmbE family N-acetylglucosaminyl deacetylase